MIKVTNWAGRNEFLNPVAIVRVEEAPVQTQHNRITCLVHFSDGKMLECKSDAMSIVTQIDQHNLSKVRLTNPTMNAPTALY